MSRFRWYERNQDRRDSARGQIRRGPRHDGPSRIYVFFPDEAADGAIHGARYAAPAFRAREGGTRGAMVLDPDGQWVELVIAPGGTPTRPQLEVGLTVSDLEKSRAFYREFVGLDELKPVESALLGTMKYPFRHGTTTVNVWSFGRACRRIPTPRAFNTSSPTSARGRTRQGTGRDDHDPLGNFGAGSAPSGSAIRTASPVLRAVDAQHASRRPVGGIPMHTKRTSSSSCLSSRACAGGMRSSAPSRKASRNSYWRQYLGGSDSSTGAQADQQVERRETRVAGPSHRRHADVPVQPDCRRRRDVSARQEPVIVAVDASTGKKSGPTRTRARSATAASITGRARIARIAGCSTSTPDTSAIDAATGKTIESFGDRARWTCASASTATSRTSGRCRPATRDASSRT